MKRLIALLLASISIFSCEEKGALVTGTLESSGDVTFRVNFPENTKSTFYDAYGSNIDEVCLMVFAPSGILYSAALLSYGEDASMSLPVGVSGFRVVAVANPSDPDIMEHCLDYEMLLSHSGYLEDGFNDEDSRVKMWSDTPDVTFTSGQVFDIKLRRLVSLVGVSNIRFRPVAAWSGYYLHVLSAYLVNVNRAYDYSGKWERYAWTNKMKYDCDSSLDCYLYKDIDVSLEADSDIDVNVSLYCCPNLTSSDSHSSVWSPRHTRLVVEAQFVDPDSEEAVAKFYYPIDVCKHSETGLEANVAYNVSCLTITGPGAMSPEGEIESLDFSVDMEIEPWSDGNVQDVTI